jgi:fatty-acid desaturase
MSQVPRMRPRCALTNPVDATVFWSPIKSLWYSGLLLIALIFAPWIWSLPTAVMTGLLTAFTLCVGHSIGFHRLLIHRSFECPVWLERVLVTIGTVVGMGGPTRMLYLHDIRDWSQRHNHCHPFFSHQSGLLRDWWWNLHCEIRLTHPPQFDPGDSITSSHYYGLLDRSWMLLQIPLAIVLYSLGGWAWVIWGVCVRVPLSLTGHWFIGYLAHNGGPRSWHLEGHAVQGYNVPGFGLISMGEAWHNNHHAFPESARFGLERGQNDPGWWLLRTLQWTGLVWNLNEPKDLPFRSELKLILAADREVSRPSLFNVRPLHPVTDPGRDQFRASPKHSP